MAITLERAKLHLRVDNDDADSEIQQMIDVATCATLDYLNLDGFGGGMPPPVEAAILLQVCDLHENRGRQSAEQLYTNRTYERLLNPYRMLAI